MLDLTFALGYDHLHDQIRVNALVPSGIATGMNEGRSRVAANTRNSVQGPSGQPMDIAHSVAFLLSDEAEMIAGPVLKVNTFAWQGGPIRIPLDAPRTWPSPRKAGARTKCLSAWLLPPSEPFKF